MVRTFSFVHPFTKERSSHTILIPDTEIEGLDEEILEDVISGYVYDAWFALWVKAVFG